MIGSQGEEWNGSWWMGPHGVAVHLGTRGLRLWVGTRLNELHASSSTWGFRYETFLLWSKSVNKWATVTPCWNKRGEEQGWEGVGLGVVRTETKGRERGLFPNLSYIITSLYPNCQLFFSPFNVPLFHLLYGIKKYHLAKLFAGLIWFSVEVQMLSERLREWAELQCV